MRFLLVLLLLFPVLELYVFFRVGLAIGFFPALLLIIAGSAFGVLVLRVAGLATALRARESLRGGQLPGEELLNGAMVAAGGLLLVIPGFLSDLLGALCLLPVTRKLIANKLRERTEAQVMRQRAFSDVGQGPSNGSPAGSPRRPNVIEGEYEHRDS
ncbi:FxsA family protein [Pseudomonas sp. RIT-PI-S]|uniref:FxsA family protein n=1 Tax=Pseudomonas sp. RIT-PI-S TaxID=3035295 RepID=UPI0021DA94F7|nr:FxsA family protein [Pseudomonas sp. RIT-PI-S]